MARRRRSLSWAPLGWIAAVVALDQGSKWGALRGLTWGEPRSLLDGYVRLALAHNPGGAFGVLSGQGPLLTWFTVGVVTVIALFVLIGRLSSTGLVAGSVMIAGGATGNLIDRIHWGYVIDFIDIGATPTLRWPTFNVADTAIVTGTALVLWHLVLGEARRWRP